MRLLECRDDGDFRLTAFQDDNTPPYAILSHTWVEGQEVTFEDLKAGTGKEKYGNKKIRFCGEQARRDGLQYFWVDTCCIDKGNYAELSHSINSMFRWYRNATRCYVYLSDLSISIFDSDNEHSPQRWESDFRKSTWFTRGWTLQELLAPSSVEFFSCEAKRVGDKSSLEHQIHEITGIPKSALRGARLSQFSDKERFSWIQHRQTKLEEDKAYALLGIFDVHIPPRYGEGMANAFKRLEEEIDKLNKCLQDLRLTDPRDDKKRIEDTKGGLLADSYRWILENPYFQQWRDDKQSRLLWIKGDPGKGKTMLLCGIVDELNKPTVGTALLSYFFCQATDSRINKATAVLRGLIYMLVGQQPSLISHVRTKYDKAGKMLFEDANAWMVLSEILTNILHDSTLQTTYLILDALDECEENRPELLAFIAQNSSVSPGVKWVVSSRNWPDIEEQINTANQKVKISLELNEKSISMAVNSYIEWKIEQLVKQKMYDNDTRDAVKRHLLLNANNTFLWVALVCQQLADPKVRRHHTLAKLDAFPPGLNDLYERMMGQIRDLAEAELCKRILAVVSTAGRPVTFDELQSFINMPTGIHPTEIIGLCGSFLTLQGRTIYLVHPSAKDYLLTKDYLFTKDSLLTKEFDVFFPSEAAPTDSGYGSGSGTKPKAAPVSGLYVEPSIYSEFSTQDRGYICQMASDLFGSVRSYESNGPTLKRISERIPDLLKAFALKVGYRAETQMHRDIAYFIRRYRNDIQSSFEDLIPVDDENIDAHGVLPGEFAIERFMDEPPTEYLNDEPPTEYPNDETEPPPEGTVQVDEGEPELVSGSESDLNSGLYRDFILATSAYKWLIASLQREARLTRATPDLMERIQEKIISVLPPAPRPRREEPSQKYMVVFELDWDPVAFVEVQEYSEAPEEVLEKVVTLTGSLNDAQAVTTKSYLCQTWPVTGEQVMRLLNDSLRSKGSEVDSVLPDGTELAVQVSDAENSGHKFLVTAVGTADSIVEIGQQFAWLGAGLRSSPFESGIAICSPEIRDIRLGDMTSSSVTHVVELFCRIEFIITTPGRDSTLPGQCWHNIFRNPVMVHGYPILSKKESGVGVEMPLNMMAGLIDTDRAIEFNLNVFIKGFSSMLVAIRIAEDLLIWHHLYNSTGDMISFDKIQQVPDNIGLSQLDSFRHVVGWCSQCICYAGADDADYNVQGSELPPTTSGCVLEKASISGGKLLTAGLSFALGVKDVPRHRPPNGYIMTLRNLEKKYVVLWDDDSKRGWLVNGTSALLHLVRAWLSFAVKDKYSSRFHFDPAKLINSINHHKPDSATEVLINASNMALPIYPGSNELSEEEETKWKMGDGSEHNAEQNRKLNTEAEEFLTLKRKKGYVLFENLVQHHLSIMYQIFEHQRDKAGENGIKIKRHVRTYLEGWDFFDLATDCDPHPRVASLNAMGYGWVDFIRSIGAITLLGCKFGDIIRPIAFRGMCPEWTSLPPDNYYLAVSAMDLKNITQRFGTTRTSPPQPVHGLVWHCPEDVVASCNGHCQGRGLFKRIRKIWKPHSDPVQVFYPKRKHGFLRLGGPERIHSDGAVVFGHNFSWKYRWRADAAHDIEECDDATCATDGEDVVMADAQVYDSGSEPSTKAKSSSVAGQSTTQACGSSSLTPSTSIFVGSNATSPGAPSSANADLADSATDLPRQSERQLSPKTRHLRREKRRLGE